MLIKTANELYEMGWKTTKNQRKMLKYDHVYLPVVVCADGFRVSIQAGAALYSIPREDGMYPYSAFELGYPSEEEPLINEYAEYYGSDGIDYTDTVYPFVPTELVDEVLRKHGYIVSFA